MSDDIQRLWTCDNCGAPLFGAATLRCSQCGHLHAAGQADPAINEAMADEPAQEAEPDAQPVVPRGRRRRAATGTTKTSSSASAVEASQAT